jgi:hypothetical protein
MGKIQTRRAVTIDCQTYDRLSAITREFGTPRSEIVEDALVPVFNGTLTVEQVLAQIDAYEASRTVRGEWHR